MTLLKILARFNYESRNWTYAKVITAIFWLVCLVIDIRDQQPEPCNTGLCHLLNCTFFTTAPVSYFIIALSILLAGFYVFERYVVLSTFLMALIGTIVFSVAEANGSMRMEAVTIVLIAQCIAYIQYYFSNATFKSSTRVYNLAMFYSIQATAACYVIAAISKLQVSGLSWISEAPNLALRIAKAANSRALDHHWPAAIHIGQVIAGAVLHHPLSIQLGLALALAIELFAFLAVASRSFSRKYAYLILAMHVMILLIMNILIPPFVVMVIAYLLNLPQKKEGAHVSVSNKKTSSVQTFKQIIYSIWLGATYLVLSLCIGEQHPFAKFPMFANMENQSSYFLLTDQNDRPISPLKYLGLRTGQIAKVIGARAKSGHVSILNDNSLKPVAEQWLGYSIYAHNTTLQHQNIQQLKLIHHHLWIEHNKIMSSDTLISIIAVPVAGDIK